LLAGARPLIVEEEFLIAVDIQRVLEGAAAKPAVLVRNYDEVAALSEALSAFDLAVVTPPRSDRRTDTAIAGRLAAAGIAVVVCSAARTALEGSALAFAEVVDKPFADDDLVAACLRALAKRRR
jgi:hypothetical protein